MIIHHNPPNYFEGPSLSPRDRRTCQGLPIFARTYTWSLGCVCISHESVPDPGSMDRTPFPVYAFEAYRIEEDT